MPGHAALDFVIAASFTADPLRHPIDFWAGRFFKPIKVMFAPFGQVFQTILDPTGDFARHKSGFNVVLIAPDDFVPGWGVAPPDPESVRDAEVQMGELREALRHAAARDSAPYLVAFCPSSVIPDTGSEWAVVERRLAHAVAGIPGVQVMDIPDLMRRYEVARVFDPVADRLASIPYTLEFFAVLATGLVRRAMAYSRPPLKVVVLDCDDTLWGGACGEQTPETLDVGGPYRELQEQMVNLLRSGVLLALCSNNVELDVLRVFERRPDMLLKLQDFVARRVDWQPKSEKVTQLSGELGLGVDSFLVIDDSPVEIEALRITLAGVRAVALPPEPAAIPRFLEHLWWLDLPPTTAEDLARSAYYHVEKARSAARAMAPSLDAFVAGLEVQVDIAPLSQSEVGRAAQMTQRTNQFNTTTLRRTEADFRSLLSRPGYEIHGVRVRDRFGDYGLTGLLVLRRDSGGMELENLLLSCRVLGRRVEHRVLSWLAEHAEHQGAQFLRVPFRASVRNEPVRRFLAWLEPDSALDGEVEHVYVWPPCELAQRVATPAGVTGASVPEQVEPAQRHTTTDDDTKSYWITSGLDTGRALLAAMRGHVAIAPGAGTPEKLQAVWATVLGRTHITPEDDFFACGGDSLQAIEAVSLAVSLGLNLTPEDLFECRTPAKVAASIGSRPAAAHVACSSRSVKSQTQNELSEMSGEGIEEVLPLSPMQQDMYLKSRLSRIQGLYVVQQVAKLRGEIDVTLLRRAWQQTVRYFPALRTGFARRGRPQAVQFVLRNAELPFFEEDWWTSDPAHCEDQLARWLAADAAAGFRLAEPPLCRIAVFHVAPGEYVLVWTHHLMVMDGWSWSIPWKYAFGTYAGLRQANPPAPMLVPPYREYIAWLGHRDRNPDEAFWRDTLSGLNAPRTFAEALGAGEPAETYSNLSMALAPKVIAGLRAASHRYGVTRNTLVQGSWALVLGGATTGPDVVFGVIVSGRPPELAGVDGMVGQFMNVVAARVDIEQDLPLAVWLQKLQQQQVAARSHQYNTATELHRWSGLRPGQPVFDTVLGYQNHPAAVPEGLANVGLQIASLTVHEKTGFPFIAYFLPGSEARLSCIYDQGVYTTERIERILDSWHKVLGTMVFTGAVGVLNLVGRASFALCEKVSAGEFRDVNT